MKARGPETKIPLTIQQEELRGISRSVGEIEWLLLIVVLLYHVFGGTDPDNRDFIVVAMVIYTACVMGFRYANFLKHESRWKLAIETWVMTAFITAALWHTGRLDSPLLNTYLLVIITSALALGKLTTLLELVLIAACLILLGGDFSAHEMISFKYLAGLFAQLAPFVLVAYITTMFASDIRYGISKSKALDETDELTAALNQRGFAITADRLFGLALRYDRPLSLLVIDCDNLKQINDEQGAKASDMLLLSLAKHIQAHLRSDDIMARQSGDEFVVLLTETPHAGAVDVAERIRNAVAASSLTVAGKPITSTVSIGTATYHRDGRTLDLLMAHADRNMRQARTAGRNRVSH